MRVGLGKWAGVWSPDLQTTLDKCYVDESDRRDLRSDTSGPISSRTRRKSKLHRSTNLTPGGDGYGESDNAETGVPSDNEVDDAISGDVVVVSAPGRRPEVRATDQLHNALDRISFWMIANLRTLNSSKTDFLLIGLSKQLAKINNSSLTTTLSARNLGLIFDEHLPFSDQILSVSKSCYYHIRQLRCIRPYCNSVCNSWLAYLCVFLVVGRSQMAVLTH